MWDVVFTLSLVCCSGVLPWCVVACIVACVVAHESTHVYSHTVPCPTFLLLCCSALQRFLRTSSSWIMVGAAAFCFVLLLEVCMNLYMYRFLVNPPARLVKTKAMEKEQEAKLAAASLQGYVEQRFASTAKKTFFFLFVLVLAGAIIGPVLLGILNLPKDTKVSKDVGEGNFKSTCKPTDTSCKGATPFYCDNPKNAALYNTCARNQFECFPPTNAECGTHNAKMAKLVGTKGDAAGCKAAGGIWTAVDPGITEEEACCAGG